jgi:hypothetical protein
VACSIWLVWIGSYVVMNLTLAQKRLAFVLSLLEVMAKPLEYQAWSGCPLPGVQVPDRLVLWLAIW